MTPRKTPTYQLTSIQIYHLQQSFPKKIEKGYFDVKFLFDHFMQNVWIVHFCTLIEAQTNTVYVLNLPGIYIVLFGWQYNIDNICNPHLYPLTSKNFKKMVGGFRFSFSIFFPISLIICLGFNEYCVKDVVGFQIRGN